MGVAVKFSFIPALSGWAQCNPTCHQSSLHGRSHLSMMARTKPCIAKWLRVFFFFTFGGWLCFRTLLYVILSWYLMLIIACSPCKWNWDEACDFNYRAKSHNLRLSLQTLLCKERISLQRGFQMQCFKALSQRKARNFGMFTVGSGVFCPYALRGTQKKRRERV